MFGISINTVQNQKAGSACSPRAVVGSPRAVVGSPRAVVDSPRAADGSPISVSSPRHLGSPRAKGSPKTVEVGEIDTRAPFQSVKAAVSLFGEVGASPRSQAPTVKKTKSAEERVLEKEHQLHLALNELDAFKIQMRNSEATKAQALRDLDKARGTLQELAGQLGTINKSEQAAIEAIEASRFRVKELEDKKSSRAAVGSDAWKRHVKSEREHYIASATELNSVKQQFAELRQDFDAAMKVKMAAIQKASRAQNAAVVNRERVIELSKEVATLREALAKLTSLQSQEEHTKLIAGKQGSLISLRMAKEEAEMKMQAINEEFDPDLTEHLKARLDETSNVIEVLREQLKSAKSADLNAWKTAASELETAKEAMQEVVALENSLRSQVDSLKLELDNPEKNQPKLKNNPSTSKEELEPTIKEHTKDVSDDVASKIHQLSSEAEVAIREAEEMKNRAEAFRKEAEMARIAAKEAEEKLELVLKEAEERRATATLADNEIHYSSRTPAIADPAISKLNGKIKLSKDEYESLKKKIELMKKVPNSKRMSITSCHSGCFKESRDG